MPGLVLIDVHIPGLQPAETIAYVRDHWKVSDRVYLFSSLREDELKLRSAQYAADGFVSKAAGLEGLLSVVASLDQSAGLSGSSSR